MINRWNLDRCYCLNINILTNVCAKCLGPSWWHSSEGLWKLWLYDTAKRNTSLRGFEGYTWLFLSFPLFLLTICWMVSFSHIFCNHDVIPHHRPRINVSKEQELKSLKQAPQIFTEFFLQVFTLSSAKVTNTEISILCNNNGTNQRKIGDAVLTSDRNKSAGKNC